MSVKFLDGITVDGDVGVGTTSPITYSGYKTLTVDGSSGAVLRLDRTDNTNQFEIAVSSSFTYLKNINSKDLWFGTNNSERMRITSAGKVGIGTTSPSHPLSVVSSYPQIKIQQTGQTPYFTFGSGTGFAVFDGVGTSNGLLDIRDDGTSRMRFDTAGNVGIGTSSPTKKLDVNGDITFGTGNKFQTITNALEGVGANGVYLRSAISSAANPSFSNSDDTNTGMFLPGSDVLGLSTAGNERLRIDSSGNVGIGIYSPAETLDVDGTGRFRNDLTLDKKITADDYFSSPNGPGGSQKGIHANVIIPTKAYTLTLTFRSGLLIGYNCDGEECPEQP